MRRSGATATSDSQTAAAELAAIERELAEFPAKIAAAELAEDVAVVVEAEVRERILRRKRDEAQRRVWQIELDEVSERWGQLRARGVEMDREIDELKVTLTVYGRQLDDAMVRGQQHIQLTRRFENRRNELIELLGGA